MKTCFFAKKIISQKKTWIFLVKRSSDFERLYWGLLILKLSSKSIERISRYVTVSKLSFCLQIQIFFSKSPNGSIRKVNWLESKSEHFLQNRLTTGDSLEPRALVLDFFWRKGKTRFQVILLTSASSVCLILHIFIDRNDILVVTVIKFVINYVINYA